MISDLWAKAMAFAAVIAGIFLFKQAAKSQGKTEAKVTEQAEKLIERDRIIISNAKSNEIEERNGKLSGRDLFDGLRKYAREDDELQLGKRNKLNGSRDK